MSCTKVLGLAAVASLALIAFFAGNASATTLENGGTAQNSSVIGSASLKSGTSASLSRTDGSLANTCTGSNISISTANPFTALTVGGPVGELALTGCSMEPIVVHEAGSLSIEWSSGTNGTVRSAGAEITVPTSFGKVNCKTGTGTHFGILTGVGEGNATMDVSAVLNCGFLLPSGTLKGTYTVTGALGVVA